MAALLSELEPDSSQFGDSGLPPKSKIDRFRSGGIQLRFFRETAQARRSFPPREEVTPHCDKWYTKRCIKGSAGVL
jgi:hypothetical protein